MILALKSGALFSVTVIRETNKAWVIQYHGEQEKQTRVPKDGRREMFARVSDAEQWMRCTK